MNNEFKSVSAELREIEEEFTSGRMNAFGTAATRDNFINKLSDIAKVETQIFACACSLLKLSTTEEHVMHSMYFTNAEQPAGGGGNKMNNNDTDLGEASATARSSQARRDVGKGPTAHDRGSFTGSLGSDRRSCSADGRDGTTGLSPEQQVPCNKDAGFSDRPFEDISQHFKNLEKGFTGLGEHLRQISAHVLQLNDMTEWVRGTGDRN